MLEGLRYPPVGLRIGGASDHARVLEPTPAA